MAQLPASEEDHIGLVEVYTGDGKGKTTAALGLAMRAAGHGMRTYIGQFLKGWLTGELEAAKMMSPYVVIELLGEASQGHIPSDVRQAELARRGLRRVREIMSCGEFDIVILEEINVALAMGLIPLGPFGGGMFRDVLGAAVLVPRDRADEALELLKSYEATDEQP